MNMSVSVPGKIRFFENFNQKAPVDNHAIKGHSSSRTYRVSSSGSSVKKVSNVPHQPTKPLASIPTGTERKKMPAPELHYIGNVTKVARMGDHSVGLIESFFFSLNEIVAKQLDNTDPKTFTAQLFEAFNTLNAHARREGKNELTMHYAKEENSLVVKGEEGKSCHVGITHVSQDTMTLVDSITMNKNEFVNACLNNNVLNVNELITSLAGFQSRQSLPLRPQNHLGVITSSETSKVAGKTANSLEYLDYDNICPEQTTRVLAQKFNLPVEYKKADLSTHISGTHLAQIDILQVMYKHGNTAPFEGMLTCNSNEALENGVSALNENIDYLLRTGVVGGDGHFTVLRNEGNSWYRYENVDTAMKIAEKRNGEAYYRLTPAGMQLVDEYETNWGTDNGQRSNNVYAIPHQDIVVDMINYVKKCRENQTRSQSGDEVASQQLFN